MNTTMEALDLVKQVNVDGFRLNLDLGAVIYNGESLEELIGEFILSSCWESDFRHGHSAHAYLEILGSVGSLWYFGSPWA